MTFQSCRYAGKIFLDLAVIFASLKEKTLQFFVGGLSQSKLSIFLTPNNLAALLALSLFVDYNLFLFFSALYGSQSLDKSFRATPVVYSVQFSQQWTDLSVCGKSFLGFLNGKEYQEGYDGKLQHFTHSCQRCKKWTDAKIFSMRLQKKCLSIFTF